MPASLSQLLARTASRWPAILALPALLALGSVAAAVDGRAISLNGNSQGAPACIACHGERGEGNADAGYPRLAGLNAAYLAHQLASFADRSRANEIMQPVAAALSPEDQQAVAAFYAALPIAGPNTAPTPDASAKPDAALIARGARLAAIGDWPRGLPGCGQCHGPKGEGVGPTFPPLAGQPAAYLSAQLAAWQAKTRKNDPLGLMAGIAARLGPDDIAAVTAYYASLPAGGAKQGAAP